MIVGHEGSLLLQGHTIIMASYTIFYTRMLLEFFVRNLKLRLESTDNQNSLHFFQLYSWGYNGNGQLGIGNNTNQQLPARVLNFGSKVVEKVFDRTI